MEWNEGWIQSALNKGSKEMETTLDRWMFEIGDWCAKVWDVLDILIWHIK